MNYNSKFQFEDADGELIAQFTAFMVKIVKSAKIDYIRRQRHWKWEIPVDELPELPSQDLHWMDAPSDQQFNFEEEHISKAILNLPLLRRRILEMSFIDQLAAQEIAERLNCSVKFVYNQKHAALKKLRDILLKGGKKGEN